MPSYQHLHNLGKRAGGGELRLPVELMHMIFNQKAANFSSRKRNGVYTPLLVSRYWYHCAVSAASVWSKIGIDPQALYSPDAPTRLRNWLERSKRHPLAINIVDHSIEFAEGGTIELDLTDDEKKTAAGVLALISKTAERWITFSVNIPNSEHAKLIMPALRAATNLKEVSVETHPSWGSAFDASAREGGFPSLESLQLSAIHPRIDALKHYPQLGGHSVTTLTLSKMVIKYSSFKRICMEMPNLERLSLSRSVTYLGGGWPGIIPEEYETLLPRLACLTIEEGASVPREILHANPNLAVLEYTWDQGSLASNQGILAMLERCPNSLELIGVECRRDLVNAPEICPVILAQVLSRFPRLEVIEVVTSDDSLVQPHVSAIVRAVFNIKRQISTTKVEKEKPILSLYIDGYLRG